MKPLKIGNINFKNRLFLSPMVDVTDAAYRMICRKAGASMAYTEMIYIDAILHENLRTKQLMKIAPREKPVGIQITGNSVEEFKRVIPYLKRYDLVDINCGCPSIRITGNEAGSYLLQNPDKIASMIRILKEGGLTVTAKIRLGFKENNVLKVAKAIEKAGADAITVHGRLAIHGRSVPADWKWIAKVKETVSIPVIGNGDVFSGKDVEKMLKIADGVMIARGAIGDPLIFSRILHYLETGKEEAFDFKKNIESFSDYLKLAKKYNIFELGRAKYIGSNFIRETRGAAKLRGEFMQVKDYEGMVGFVDSLLSHKSLYMN
ncbi:MAG: tRNA-dihydrouridine synthase family protein [Nanoarchaeota archaeon]|nr:tRNA-dihydrouridine synthase family protein [Nanoarchaeota archaeon]